MSEHPLVAQFIKEIGADSSIRVVPGALRNKFDVLAAAEDGHVVYVSYNMTETAANVFRNMIIGLQASYLSMENEESMFHRPQAGDW